MYVKIPNDVRTILNKLNESGYEAYVVGGCVRDSLIGKKPKDWDICTNAKPEQTMEVFKGFHIIPTGLQHGTITVMLNGEGYEITTYRVDGDYSDGRHPDAVSFTSSLAEDLARRDFTFNAMAYSEDEGIVDLYGGSGSTLIASEKTQNKCFMMEYEPRYIDVIIQRWENFTGQKAIKIN